MRIECPGAGVEHLIWVVSGIVSVNGFFVNHSCLTTLQVMGHPLAVMREAKLFSMYMTRRPMGVGSRGDLQRNVAGDSGDH